MGRWYIGRDDRDGLMACCAHPSDRDLKLGEGGRIHRFVPVVANYTTVGNIRVPMLGLEKVVVVSSAALERATAGALRE